MLMAPLHDAVVDVIVLFSLQEDVFALNQQQSQLENLLEVGGWWVAALQMLLIGPSQDRNNEIKLLMYRLQDSCWYLCHVSTHSTCFET